MSNDLQRRLREGVRDLADSAPESMALAERICAEAAVPRRASGAMPRSAARGLRAWAVPALAALVAAAVIGAGVVAANSLRADHRLTPPAVIPAPSLIPAPIPTSPVPAGFAATDISFLDAATGWAIGSRRCTTSFCRPLAGPQILRTTDGGRIWTRIDSIGIVGDLTHVRFATTDIGYAYGKAGGYLSIDGGWHWRKVADSLSQLVIAGDTVLMLEDSLNLDRTTSCVEAQCGRPVLYTAKVGTGDWQQSDYTAAIGAPGSRQVQDFVGDTAQVATQGKVVALAVTHLAPGSHVHTAATLLVSTDAGRSWQLRPVAPCGSSFTLALSAGDSIAIGCNESEAVSREPVFVSHDLGQSFEIVSSGYLGFATVLAATDGWIFANAAGALYRISDAPHVAGAPLEVLPPIHNGPGLQLRMQAVGANSVVGLEQNADPSAGSNQIWVSTDAGTTWASHLIK